MFHLICRVLGLAAVISCLLITACATGKNDSPKFCDLAKLSQLKEGAEADAEGGKCQAEGVAKGYLIKHPLVLNRSGGSIQSVETISYHKEADRLTLAVTPSTGTAFYAEMYVLSVPSGRINARLVCLTDTEGYGQQSRWKDPCVSDPKAIDATNFKFPEKSAPVSSEDQLWNAAISGDLKKLEAVIGSGVDLKSDRSIFCFTTLASGGYFGPLEVMLKHGMDVNAIDSNSGFSALHRATAYANNTPDISPGSQQQMNRKRVAEILISYGANVNLANKYGVTPLHDVKSTTMADILISNGALVNATTTDGGVPLIFAAYRDANLVRLLLAKGAEVNRKMLDGRNALSAAIDNQNVEVVDVLVQNGADVNLLDRDGRTNLERVMQAGGDPRKISRIVSLLTTAGARLNQRPKDGRTELHYAAAQNNKDAIESLIKAGAKINALDRYGESPLHWAISQNSLDAVQLLIQKGADTNINNVSGTPLLHSLAIENKYAMLDIFLNNKADVNLADPNRETALFKLVKKQGNSEVAGTKLSPIRGIQRLIEAGANVNTRNLRGETPLHVASDASIAELLMSSGALINATDSEGYTPLIRATLGNREALIAVLLAHGANSLIANSAGTTALHLAAVSGNLSTVRILISNGAKSDASDSQGNGALHYAKDRRIVEYLVQIGANVNQQNNLRQSPLMFNLSVLTDAGNDPLAMWPHRNYRPEPTTSEVVDFFKALIDLGTDLNATDGEGLTAFDYCNRFKKYHIENNEPIAASRQTEKVMAVCSKAIQMGTKSRVKQSQ